VSRAHHSRAAAWELYFTTTARPTERIEVALKCQAGLSMPEYSVLLMTDRAGEEGIRPAMAPRPGRRLEAVNLFPRNLTLKGIVNPIPEFILLLSECHYDARTLHVERIRH